MRIVSRIIALLLLGLVCGRLGGRSTQIQYGSISGFIFDENGHPFEGVKIRAWKTDQGPTNMAFQWFESDRDGHYYIGPLLLGPYALLTKYEERDYPGTTFSFHGAPELPRVILNSNSPTAIKDIHLAPKGGRIVGLITDAVSGNPITASVAMISPGYSNSGWGVGVAPHYSIVVPSSTDIALEVRANLAPDGSSAGYEIFHYSGPQDPLHRKPLRLEPGQEFVLNVQLQRSTKPAAPGSSHLATEHEPEAKQPFTIVLSAEHSTVGVGLPVVIYLRLTNNSDHDTARGWWGQDNLGVMDHTDIFDVRDGHGHLLSKKKSDASIMMGNGADVGMMSPEQTRSYGQDFRYWYDLSRADTYTIQVSRLFSENERKGVVKSNTLTVTIVNPSAGSKP